MKGVLISIILFLFCFFSSHLIAQTGEMRHSIMFYNVENLFDTEDDPDTQDDEFLPKGERRWSGFRFHSKLNNLAKVIVNTGFWEPPAVIGFCEVENRSVLEMLVNHASLKNWKYRIIHKDSPDGRGIDVAAIYREDLFVPVNYDYFPPVMPGEVEPATREILYLAGVLNESDTLHFYFNHWPSRYGGLMETRKGRSGAASRLRYEIDALQARHHDPRVVVMGDFNDQPDDESLIKHLKALPEVREDPVELVNLSAGWAASGKGTLKYQSVWNVFDQIIVTGNLLNPQNPVYTTPEDSFILEAGFLLRKDERYGGMELFRTYEGYRYTGGFSDHLPVILVLRSRIP